MTKPVAIKNDAPLSQSVISQQDYEDKGVKPRYQ